MSTIWVDTTDTPPPYSPDALAYWQGFRDAVWLASLDDPSP